MFKCFDKCCTPSGRYCFKCLPYGIYSASEFFQRKVTSVISDVPVAIISQDDFIVWGETLQVLGKCLRKVFWKMRGGGLNLNKTKCQIRKQLIIFVGHIIFSEDY